MKTTRPHRLARLLVLVLAALAACFLSTAPARAQAVGRSLLVPPARYVHAMAYDSDRAVTVLFGGFNGSDANGETWEWDGRPGAGGR